MEKDQAKVISLLSGMGVFRGLTRHHIEILADDLDLSYLAAEERLSIRAGQNDNFYIIFSGSVEVSRKQNKREIDVESLIIGDHFGEFVLLGTRENNVTAIALQDTVLLLLDRQTFNRLLEEHPSIRKFLLAAIASRKLVYARRFTWLSKNEHIYLILRKHWTYLLVSLVGPTLAAWLALVLIFFSFDIQTTTFRLVVEWGGIIGFMAVVVWALWVVIDWANDYYIITDQRAIWL